MSQDNGANDRRQHGRLPKNFRVELSPLRFPLHDQPVIAITSLDISAGGLLVECPEPFAAGDKLQVRIYIASLNKYHPGFLKALESDAGQYLQAIAEVVRTEPVGAGHRLGLRFVDIDEDDWKALEKLLARALADG